MRPRRRDDLAFSPDGRHLYYGCADGFSFGGPPPDAYLRVRDADTLALEHQVAVAARIHGWRFLDERRAVACIGKELQVWDVERLEAVQTLPLDGPCHGFLLSEDRRTLVFATRQTVRVHRVHLEQMGMSAAKLGMTYVGDATQPGSDRFRPAGLSCQPPASVAVSRMPHFSKAFVDFFRNLAKHNDTSWFEQNRKVYETEVKRPFEAFTKAMIARIAAVDSEVAIAPKDAISRINRDTRFGADKRPYNTHLSAAISKFGKKNKEYPGILFRLSHEGVAVFGGCYAPEKETLAAIRALIEKDGKAFQKAITGAGFRKRFGELQGEELKRIPPEWVKAHANEPLIAKKQFFYEATLPAALVLDDKLPDVLMQHFEAGRPVNAFLRRAFR